MKESHCERAGGGERAAGCVLGSVLATCGCDGSCEGGGGGGGGGQVESFEPGDLRKLIEQTQPARANVCKARALTAETHTQDYG